MSSDTRRKAVASVISILFALSFSGPELSTDHSDDDKTTNIFFHLPALRRCLSFLVPIVCKAYLGT